MMSCFSLGLKQECTTKRSVVPFFLIFGVEHLLGLILKAILQWTNTDEAFVDLDHVAATRQGGLPAFLITKRSLFSTQQQA
jgi:hypothetical protein